jgi:hypothetical protein
MVIAALARLRIETDSLDAFHAELSSKDYKYARPGIEEMPWGSIQSIGLMVVGQYSGMKRI